MLALLVLMMPATLSAQSPQPADWVDDVAVLLAAIDSLHPDPYRVHTRADFADAARRLERALPTLTYDQAVAGFARILTLLEDGHSRMGHVQLSSHTQPTLAPLAGPGFDAVFPVRFEFFADGLFVTGADSAHRGLLGGRVVRIADRPAADAGRALSSFIAADNDAWRFYLLPEYLRHPGYLHAAGLLPDIASPLVLTVARADGSTVTAELAPRPQTPAPVLLDAHGPVVPLWRQFAGYFGLHYFPERAVLYVRYRVVQPDGDETVAAFASRVVAAMDTLAVSRVVLDVRRNGGGNNYLNQPLIHGLLRERRLAAPGALVVLTDRGTYSAAISLIAELEREFWAVFLGEPSGAPVNHYGDPARVTLPRSGLLVRIATLYWQGSDPRDRRPAILPDSVIVPTFAEWQAGRDPVLEAALRLDARSIEWRSQPNQNWSRPAQRRESVTGVRW